MKLKKNQSSLSTIWLKNSRNPQILIIFLLMAMMTISLVVVISVAVMINASLDCVPIANGIKRYIRLSAMLISNSHSFRYFFNILLEFFISFRTKLFFIIIFLFLTFLFYCLILTTEKNASKIINIRVKFAIRFTLSAKFL